MDDTAFDRLTRIVSLRLTRRQGAGALAALLGAAGVDAPAEAGVAIRERGGRAGKPGSEGPCGNGSRKANVCTKNGDCCTGVCDTSLGKRNRDGKGRCRCLNQGNACEKNANCCGGAKCTGGVCGGCGASCKQGCCDGQTCRAGTSDDACGRNGRTCVACAANEECSGGQCVPLACRSTLDGIDKYVAAKRITRGIAADAARVYFTVRGAGTGNNFEMRNQIQSMKLDGTGLMTQAFSVPLAGMAINPADGMLVAMSKDDVGFANIVDKGTLISTKSFGTFSLVHPYAAAFDSVGALWVSADPNRVASIPGEFASAVAADISPVCGNSPSAQSPRGLAFGPGGLLFGTCFEQDMIVVIDPAASAVLAAALPIEAPYGIAFDGAIMYVVTKTNPATVQSFEVTVANGVPSFAEVCGYTFAALRTAGPAAFDAAGTMWIARGYGKAVVTPPAETPHSAGRRKKHRRRPEKRAGRAERRIRNGKTG